MRCLILVSFMFSAAMATAAPLDIHVPGDYPAIQLAIDAALDGDTIIVAPGTYYENIDFIGKGITVMGEQGPELTVIDGMQASSVVRFLNSESESSLLQGFTLTHGIGYLVSSITYGGGVFCGTRCRPTLRDLIIKGNEAGKGGGVYSLTSAPTLEHCIISGNEATVWGSGLYCQDGSEMKLIHCTVTENFTENSGGGMYCDCASPSIVNCIFSDNIANVWGAGIYSNYGDHKLTITNVTFVRNGSSKPGSGIYSRSNAQITNSIFWNYGPSEIVLNAKATFDVTYSLVRGGWPGNHNIDEHPGFLSTYNGDYHIVATSPCRDAGTNDAPLISQTDMDGEARIVNGTVDIGADEFSTPHGAPGSYTVPGDYAGIQEAIDASFPGDVITVQPGTYYENLDFKGQPITLRSSAGPEQTVIHGGVGVSGNRPVVTFSFLEQSDTVLDGFTITNGTGYSVVGSNQSCGGGICCRSTRPLLMNNVVEGNSATYGGGIYSNCSNSYGSQEIVDCIIRDNDGDLGSGMHVTGYALIEGCVVKDNRSGGGIYAKTSNDDRVTIRNGLIENNDSAPGINVTGMGEAIIENSSILNNHNEEGNGGGIQLGCFVNNTIRYNTIAGNFARNGGGIYVWKKSFRIEDNTIACNIAKGSGGGMRCVNSIYALFTNNIFCYNTAESNTAGNGGDGGGLSSSKADGLRMFNCLIYKNIAVYEGGGISFSAGTGIQLGNLTLVGNDAFMGSGIHGKGEVEINIANSIFRNEGDFEIYSITSTPTVGYSNVRGGWPGAHNLDADPLFVDEAENDFHLRYDSPCRNTGSNDYVMSSEDMEGDPRIAYGLADMGADEFHPHLYYQGTAKPGYRVDIKIPGMPGTSFVGLFVGSGVLDPPLPTAWGLFYLQSPYFLYMLPAIPASGVLTFNVMIPVSTPAPSELPLQAIIGLGEGGLSNLCMMQVKG